MVNLLTGADLATKEVRERDGKGRHQTTRRTLNAKAGIILIDSPGVREIAAVEDEESIEAVFADILEIARGCLFADCTHGVEPDCAVQAAIADGRLDAGRLERYQRMLYESKRNDAGHAREQRQAERKASKNATRGRRFMMAQKGRRN